MGNCCASESSMNWGGDDWGSLSSTKRRGMCSGKVFDEVHEASLEKVLKEKLLGELRASSDANGKVKIKISKKELAQLLGGKENNKQLGEEVHASAEQVLTRLIHARDHGSNEYNDVHHRPWRPVLQSIPEIN